MPRAQGFDGISVLINDVERFRAYEGGIYGSGKGVRNFTWVRHDERLPEYFRFGFISGRGAGDYSKAGVWGVDGGWTDPKPGPSR